MKRTIFIYGISLALVVLVLQIIEYKHLMRSLSTELYIGAIAIIFTVLGVWGGTKLVTRKPTIVKETIVKEVIREVGTFTANDKEVIKLGISSREYEVLELMATGYSNQEIADKLYISLNTVKTHSSNIYIKLDVKRRTQAVQRAKELSLIP